MPRSFLVISDVWFFVELYEYNQVLRVTELFFEFQEYNFFLENQFPCDSSWRKVLSSKIKLEIHTEIVTNVYWA